MFFLAVSGSVLAAPPNISPLTKRFQLGCYDNGGGYRPVGEAQRCVDLLMKKDTEPCTVHGQNTVFCRDGNTVITGANVNAKGSTSSYWYVKLFSNTGACVNRDFSRDVASSAQKIIDRCTRPNGMVAGKNSEASGGPVRLELN
jgi:hypothetical protein